ncbi:HD domain-containing protein [Antarcticirhabdus aurantiaca]|uniref:HD domain-containing protein n=1 Tax=Antarcticirhabdus aurantiaca TaxID=2606717 RepID=A0ACD4NHE1_9HYPH|nr:HD domain-containing protein [Antarcticirhabdus aurantiaca]WAJ26233.1 HD domain-containing protein [Jeongeuplla avenae]
MATFERALALAREAHAGQIDKAGAPYIAHVERVAAGVHRPDEKIVAILHDVVEDNPDWTVERLSAEGFSDRIVAAVDALTRREGEDYFDFVRRAMADPLARPVKRADLLDNLDKTRLSAVTPEAEARMERYRRALAMIDEAGAPKA